AGEKALLFIKRGEKVLKECRKKEWDEAEAKKLHRWNGRQVFWSQCYFKDRFGPCHEKRGHRNADEQKEFDAHPVNFFKSGGRKMRSARIAREKTHGE